MTCSTWATATSATSGTTGSTNTVPVGSTQGNAVLLEAFTEHQASTAAQRALAVPLLVFAAVSRNKTHKGDVEFCGVAVIERIERIEQEAKGRPFPNYRYDLVVLDLSAENDRVDWAWIEARGNPKLSAGDVLEHAPRSWRQWVEHGHSALPEVRRRTPLSERGFTSRPHSTGDNRQSPGLFPAPRRPDDTASTSPGPAEPLEQLTASMLVERLGSLKVHQNNGRPSRHKPLALLWALSRIATGQAGLRLGDNSKTRWAGCWPTSAFPSPRSPLSTRSCTCRRAACGTSTAFHPSSPPSPMPQHSTSSASRPA